VPDAIVDAALADLGDLQDTGPVGHFLGQAAVDLPAGASRSYGAILLCP
jgi:hypothetical protein